MYIVNENRKGWWNIGTWNDAQLLISCLTWDKSRIRISPLREELRTLRGRNFFLEILIPLQFLCALTKIPPTFTCTGHPEHHTLSQFGMAVLFCPSSGCTLLLSLCRIHFLPVYMYICEMTPSWLWRQHCWNNRECINTPTGNRKRTWSLLIWFILSLNYHGT